MLPRLLKPVILAGSLFFQLAASDVHAKAMEDRDWIEVRTANFVVRSDLGQRKVVQLARYLELFRAMTQMSTSSHLTESSIPTQIYVFKKKGDFVDIGLDSDAAGMFLSGLRNNTIVMRDTSGMRETSTILHEYAHFMMRNQGSLRFPIWFDEGFAEYISASRVRRDAFEVGLFPRHRRDNLMYSLWIPMRKILSLDGYGDWGNERKAMFYAESWALVHYLINRRRSESSFAREMTLYVKLVEDGKAGVSAFEEAFGLTAGRLDRKVKSYLKGRHIQAYALDIDLLLPEFHPRVRKLSREQASLALGQLALRLGEMELAERVFKIAIGGEASRPWAESGLGDVLKFRGEYDEARPHFERAVELAPDDFHCRLDLAEYWHTCAYETEGTEQRSEHLKLARKHYVRAWKLDDSKPELYAEYGNTFLMEGQHYDKAVEMLKEAGRLLPSNLDIRLMQAEAYAANDQLEAAERAARSVLAWSHSESETAKRASEILEQLRRNANQQVNQRPRSRGAGGARRWR